MRECREPPLAYSEWVASGEGAADVAQARDENLDLRFRAAKLLLSQYPTDPYAKDLRAAYSALEQRGEAQPRHHLTMQGATVATRDFATARRLHAQHPEELPPLPQFEDAFGGLARAASAWVLAKNGRDFERAASLLPATGIVVVGDPICHFSQNAARVLRQDPTLAPIFERHAAWLLPPARQAQQFADVATWNRAYPAQAMQIAYSPAEWKEIGEWGTPQFYFFRNGTLVAHVNGWPREGNEAALLEAVRSAGLR